MYPGKWAAENPEKPAVIMADTEAVLTYGQLEDRSLRLANHMRAAGLVKGDHIAVMAENRFEIVEHCGPRCAPVGSSLWSTHT